MGKNDITFRIGISGNSTLPGTSLSISSTADSWTYLSDSTFWDPNLGTNVLQAKSIYPENFFKLYENLKEVTKMRYLWEIFLVHPEKEEIIEIGKVIAKNREEALLKADATHGIKESLDNYDIICKQIGEVRPKREIQEVKIIKEE